MDKRIESNVLTSSPTGRKQRIYSMILLTVFLVVFLYDPSGAAVGPALFGESSILSGISWSLGCVIWILGILFWISAGLLLTVVATPRVAASLRERIQEINETDHDLVARVLMGKPSRWMRLIGTITAIVGLLSGFWFTGSGLLALEVSWPFYTRWLLDTLKTLPKQPPSS